MAEKQVATAEGSVTLHEQQMHFKHPLRCVEIIWKIHGLFYRELHLRDHNPIVTFSIANILKLFLIIL
jgi:hypothetical protein